MPDSASTGERRGARTRQKLVEAALHLFGTRGYHGTTVRQIANAAHANVAAVTYHFGGKEELYLEVARYIGASTVTAFAGLADMARGELAEAGNDRMAACRVLSTLMQRFVRQVIRTRRNEAIIGFVMGENLRPTAAFPILYNSGMRHFQETLATLVLRASNRPLQQGEAALIAMTLFGQAISFGIGHTILLARLGQTELSEGDIDNIAAIIGRTSVASLADQSVPVGEGAS